MLDTDLAPWPGTDPQPTGDGIVDDYVTARMEAPDLCPRWAARVFTDVKVGPVARVAEGPDHGRRHAADLKRRRHHQLRDAGVGEPTHAFDLDKVAGREIIVRRAIDGEPVTTLDGQQRTLDTEMLVIGDAEKPSAIGGLMGAEWSEVTDSDHHRTDGVRQLRRAVDPVLIGRGWGSVPRAQADGRRALTRTCRRGRWRWPPN